MNEFSNKEQIVNDFLERYILIERKEIINSSLKWDEESEKINKHDAIKDIRQENNVALSYSIMWLGLVSVVFALVANLFDATQSKNLNFLLIYIEILYLTSIILFITSSMLFWNGSSTDHSYIEHAKLNENGDSLVMVGSLILLIGLSFLCSYYLLKTTEILKIISLYFPILFVSILLSILNNITVITHKRKIITHYFIEAARFPFYGTIKKEPEEGLIKILDDERKRDGLIILSLIFLLMIIVPYFLI